MPRLLRALVRSALAVSLAAVGVMSPPAIQAGAAARPAAPVPTTAGEWGWQDQLVDAFGEVGFASALALDQLDRPHIVYLERVASGDQDYGSLRYAVWNGAAWRIEVLDAEVVEVPPAIAVDRASGVAHVLYVDMTPEGDQVRYAVGGLGAWTYEVVQRTVTQTIPGRRYLRSLSLDLDTTGTPRVAFAWHLLDDEFGLATDTHRIRYGYPTGAAWQLETVAQRSDPSESFFRFAVALALDNQDRPHLAYSLYDQTQSLSEVFYARLDGSWQVETLATNASSPDLALDSGGRPHVSYLSLDEGGEGVYVTHWDGAAWQAEMVPVSETAEPRLALDFGDRPHLLTGLAVPFDGLQYSHWTGSDWQVSEIEGSRGGSLALDQLGNPHVSFQGASIDDRFLIFSDLHYASWAPAWQAEPAAASGFQLSLGVDLYGQPHVTYWDAGALHFAQRGRQWQYPFDLAGAFNSAMRLTFALRDPIVNVAYQDLATGSIRFAQWSGNAVMTQTIAGGGSTGLTNIDLALDTAGDPIVGYWDAAANQIRLAERTGGAWQVHTNDAAPFLDGDSAFDSLSLGHTPVRSAVCCRSYIAYYGHNAEGGVLRLATWDGAHWTDEPVDGGPGLGAGYFASLGVDDLSGEPAVAYFDINHDALKYAARVDGAWQTETVTTSVNIYDLSLDLGANSAAYPRIAFSLWPTNSVFLAFKTPLTTTWQFEEVFPGGPVQLREVELDSRDRDRILFAGGSSAAVSYAYRTATLPFPLYFNPLRPCTELDFIPPLVSGRALPGAPESRAGTGPAEAAPDLGILRGLRDLFATDPDGLRYIDLYYQHAAETGAIGLADPGLLWFAYLTLQDFLPGFEKVVAGHGDQVAITQAMVDQANHLADRLVAAGSPALGAAIDQERAAYDGLQDFVGLTFSEATELIGVPAPAALHALYLPVVPK